MFSLCKQCGLKNAVLEFLNIPWPGILIHLLVYGPIYALYLFIKVMIGKMEKVDDESVDDLLFSSYGRQCDAFLHEQVIKFGNECFFEYLLVFLRCHDDLGEKLIFGLSGEEVQQLVLKVCIQLIHLSDMQEATPCSIELSINKEQLSSVLGCCQPLLLQSLS